MSTHTLPRRICAYSALNGLSLGLFTSLDVLYLSWAGMSWVQIGLLAAIFNVLVLAAELPSSLIADVISAKAALLGGIVIRAAGLTLFAFPHSFLSLASAEALTGVGAALVSGSFDKILVSNTPSRADTIISHSYSVMSRLGNTGTILGVVTGVSLFAWQPRLVWLLAATMMALAGIAAWGLHDSHADSSRPTLGDICRYTPTILRSRILWASVICSASSVAPYLLWQRLTAAGGLAAVAVVGVLIAGASWCGARLSSTSLCAHIPPTAIVAANMMCVLTLGCLTLPLIQSVMFLLHVMTQTIMGIRVYGMFHAHIPDQFRASATSLASLGDSGLVALGSYVTGTIMAQWGLPWAMAPSVALYALLILLMHTHRASTSQ